MKSFLINILFVLFSLKSIAQYKVDFKFIDSIQNRISQSSIKDSLVIANANFSIAEHFRYNFVGDSAYYYYQKSEKIYKNLGESFLASKALYGIAVIRCNEKDFTGSEVTSFEAISLLESLRQTNEVKKYKSYIYNNLGLAFGQLELYEESISYYVKALDIKKNLEGNNKSTIANSRNNLALTYKMSGRFDLALNVYGEILENDNLIYERPDFYALVLDNYAHTQYLNGNYENLPELYFNALKVTDSINPEGGYNSIIINQHLSKFYYDKKNIDSARHYAYKAKKISQNYSNDELLTSLLLLSKVENGDKALAFLNDYIELNDSLQKAERKIRNKFARIRFETQQIEQENVRIARERFWLIIVAAILLVSALLIYIIISQRSKNKELVFAKQQQEANEEIYNLMLGEHEKIEEARALEKKRISEELHDGVLGRLFGTRLSLDSLNMNNSVDAIKTRGQYIDELKTIENDIRKVSHELNTDFISGSGFIDIIKTLVETQTKIYKLDYTLECDDDINWDGISNRYKINIYRMLQENLHNIYKHAKASRVDISFVLKNNVICINIKDDGSGFDVTKAKTGIGLKNMNSRIKEVEGKLDINSKVNYGTTVTIEVPLKYHE